MSCVFSHLPNEEVLKKHIDVMHFDPCPICETAFSRSVDKRAHIAAHHNEMMNDLNPSEENFQSNIQRQSTLINEEEHGTTVRVQFVGKVLDSIKDMKKRRRGTK